MKINKYFVVYSSDDKEYPGVAIWDGIDKKDTKRSFEGNHNAKVVAVTEKASESLDILIKLLLES